MKTIAIDPEGVRMLPGLHGSGPGHWQSRWETRYGYRRVEQHDWDRPLRGDWSARLEEVVRDHPGPLVLVAHSLGCWLVAAWAAHSGLATAGRVRAALLVAPPDVAREDVQGLVPGWARTPLQALPFPAQVVFGSNDPWCTAERARALAAVWGAGTTEAGARGHLNADSGLGDWAQGHALLLGLLERSGTAVAPARAAAPSPEPASPLPSSPTGAAGRHDT